MIANYYLSHDNFCGCFRFDLQTLLLLSSFNTLSTHAHRWLFKNFNWKFLKILGAYILRNSCSLSILHPTLEGAFYTQVCTIQVTLWYVIWLLLLLCNVRYPTRHIFSSLHIWSLFLKWVWLYTLYHSTQKNYYFVLHNTHTEN